MLFCSETSPCPGVGVESTLRQAATLKGSMENLNGAGGSEIVTVTVLHASFSPPANVFSDSSRLFLSSLQQRLCFQIRLNQSQRKKKLVLLQLQFRTSEKNEMLLSFFISFFRFY